MEIDEISKIDSFLFETHKVLETFNNLKQEYTAITYLIDNCYRSYDILVSVDCLCKKINNQKEIEHPLGILLRSGLYDFINFQFYSNKCISKNILDSKKFQELIDGFLKNHFNKIKWNPDLKELYKNIVEFKNDGKLKDYNSLGILGVGRSFANEKKLNYLQFAIDCWEWYSKYEHYGYFTNNMLMDFDGNYKRLNRSVNILFVNIYFSLMAIFDIDSNILKLDKFKQLEKFILK